jgi:hypothetical protein
VTFGWPIAATTVAIVAAALAGLAVVAYILKMRRRRFEVPFSSLWQRVLREKEASSLWKHLRRILSLLLQFALMGLLVFAVLDPSCGSADDDARDVVIIVDASASMKTADLSDGDGKPMTCMEAAGPGAGGAGLGDGDSARSADDATTPLTTRERLPRLRAVIDDAAKDTPPPAPEPAAADAPRDAATCWSSWSATAPGPAGWPRPP